MMMALLPAKRDGSVFDLALHHWKQPIENMFAVQALKLWSIMAHFIEILQSLNGC
jgi:hypothetical protein